MRKHILSTIALLVMVVIASGTSKKKTSDIDSTTKTSSSSSVTKWYEGGTLHKKSALDWQAASSSDKLATCADFVAGMWKDGELKPSINDQISTMDDIRSYAQELVEFLDAAFKPDPDPKQNKYMFANQKVASFAAMGVVSMGWTKE